MSDKINLNKIKEFKKGFQDFINKGDVVKLAIAFIMGQLFTKVVSSLSTDIIMPPITWIFNSHYSLKDLKIKLNSEISINYGNFMQNVFEFLSVSLAIYIVLCYFSKQIKKHYQTNPQAQQTTHSSISLKEKEQIAVLNEIKEILKNKK
ncbi:large conductance mechanosensitive channel protein MscL [Candidatus Phytoplasma melaleucae]|uniref:Large conductance mechanosensitive channel protein MscL n=1 Tax=Candidatus Phytoplasma melaleucae TaxID=2982630 RepID=A0ABT9DDC8_9MOLU|nr:large conductance mechanosensitive channel protein MscL ['Melaleuca sp.' phytoplasma]MDO8167888.1 large conductance mechanosensitive channel protein MscL ['Melaleuca sp.' phytoplasma]MDV3205205.1 large conductance mechanosensitive channel protein MscL [Weeping tea tree witches'-broom phytoplasma]